MEQIKNDLSELHLSKDLTRDRNRWRRQSHFQIIISFISCLSCLMSSCCFPAYIVFLPTVLLFCFKIDFLHMAFCAGSFTLEAIMSLQILFMQDTFLFGGKIGYIPLVLLLKGGRVWSVCLLSSPRPCLQTRYWVDDDDEFVFYS